MSTSDDGSVVHGVELVLAHLQRCLGQQSKQAAENLELASAALAVAVLQHEQAAEQVRFLSRASVMMAEVQATLPPRPARPPHALPILTCVTQPTASRLRPTLDHFPNL